MYQLIKRFFSFFGLRSTLLDRDDTVIIRSDFEGSLCSLKYSHKRKSLSACCQ